MRTQRSGRVLAGPVIVPSRPLVDEARVGQQEALDRIAGAIVVLEAVSTGQWHLTPDVVADVITLLERARWWATQAIAAQAEAEAA